MKKKLTKLFSIGFLCLSLYTFGQQKSVTGQVTDSNGFPVQEAYVHIEGTEDGVYTDENGNYSIQAKSGDIINIEYIGFKSKSIEVNQANNYNVQLTTGEKEVSLDDLIVIGYGSARDIASTASNVSVVSGDNIKNRPSTNTLDALQGQVAGLQIYTSSGEPSEVSSIRLHGIGSIGGSNTPLFVLDGMQVSSSILSTINADDISNISVLKDAAATSIYGARAANGVVYITTKKGKRGDGNFSLNIQQGYSTFASTKFYDNLMNAEELTDFWLETGFLQSQDELNALRKDFPYDTDWKKVYFKEFAPITQLNASFSGGGEKTTYYISGSYLDQQGLAKSSDLKKYTLRTNIESDVKEWLKIGTNLSLVYSRYSTNPYFKESEGNGGVFWLAQPIYSPVDENGNEYERIPGWDALHPNYLERKVRSYNRNIEVNPTGFVELTPLKNLTLRSQGGIQLSMNRATHNRLPSHVENFRDGASKEEAKNQYIKSITNTAEYKFNLANNHSFILLAGQEFVEGNYEGFSAESSGQTNDNLILLMHGTKNKNVDQGKSDYAYSSLFGRVEYDYNKKYYVNASLRRDGSSRFGVNNRFANFWSTGVMWKAKREHFISDIDWLSDLTLKASIGTSGNSSGIGNYSSLESVAFSQYGSETGYTLATPGNPSLTWESQTLSNITANIGLFNRIDLEVSLYDRKTENLIFDAPLPHTTGFSYYSKNIGSIQNRGVDVVLKANILNNNDFYLNSYINFNYNKDKVLELFQNKKYWVRTEGDGYAVGKSVAFVAPIFRGIDTQTGSPEWYIPNEENIMETRKDDTQITNSFGDNLRQNTGIKRFAPINGGFGISSGYKGFTLDVDFSFVLGKHLMNGDRFFSENPNLFPGYNQSRVVKDYWKKPGDQTRFPSYSDTFTQYDTRLIEDASFLRLKNISIGYNLPKYLMDKIGFLEGVRAYATGRNLLTFTKYSGIDPEVDSDIVLGMNPNTKQYVFGVEFNF